MSARALAAVVVATMLALHSIVTFAQTYPVKPIRLIVGYPPGAQSDATARATATKLGEILGQPVIVENRSGASSTIAAELVANSPPDGYTMLLGGSSNLAQAPFIFSELRYDPVRDFVHVGRILKVSWMLAVRSTFPAATLAEFFDYARAHPGEVTFAMSATGTQIAGTMLMRAARVQVVDVPYKGTVPAVADVIGGRVDFTLADFFAVAPHAQAGTLRFLATTGSRRALLAPDVPTVAEQGFPGFVGFSWSSLAVPRGTPPETVAVLRRALRQALRDREFRANIERLGFEPVDEDPEEFGAVLKSEIDRFGQLIKDAGLSITVQ
jgi:tripartite-type tricarboxylate transporter receptor subunit TctC